MKAFNHVYMYTLLFLYRIRKKKITVSAPSQFVWCSRIERENEIGIKIREPGGGEKIEGTSIVHTYINKTLRANILMS